MTKEIEYPNFIICTNRAENEEITLKNFFKEDLCVLDNSNDKRFIELIKRQEVTFRDVVDLLSGDEKRAKVAIKNIMNRRLFKIVKLISIL